MANDNIVGYFTGVILFSNDNTIITLALKEGTGSWGVRDPEYTGFPIKASLYVELYKNGVTNRKELLEKYVTNKLHPSGGVKYGS